MSTPHTVSFPVRMPAELKAQVTALADELDLSEQDVMRLCLRIGLTDIETIKKDHAALVKEAADECGASFASWARDQAATKDAASGKLPAPTVIPGPVPDSLQKKKAAAQAAALHKPTTSHKKAE